MELGIFNGKIFPLRDKLFRFALRITGSQRDAEDVVQDVFEKIWRAPAEQNESVLNWEAWCMTLTRNRSLDRLKILTTRRTSPIEYASGIINVEHGPEQLVISKDTVALVQRLIQQLPEKQRLVMHLRDVENFSYEEIAETLEISLDQVKTNLHRARKTIRTELENIDNK